MPWCSRLAQRSLRTAESLKRATARDLVLVQQPQTQPDEVRAP